MGSEATLVTSLYLSHLFKDLISKGLPWWTVVKKPPCNAGDVGLIPGQDTMK